MNIDSKLHLVIYLSISIILFMIICIILQVLIIKKIITFGRDRSFLNNKDREITLGLKQTRDINIFNADDDLKYSGLSVWKNNILMVNIGQQVTDHATGSNDTSHQYVLPLLPINTAATDTTQNTINHANGVEQLQHLQRAVDEHQADVADHSSQFSLVDGDQNEQDQAQPIYRQPEYDHTGADFREHTATSSTLDVEPVSELDRYHQDYDQEKVRVRSIVEQHDLELSAAAAAMPEAYIDTAAPVISEAVVTDTDVPVLNEEVVTDSEAPVMSEDIVTDTTEPVMSEAVVADIEVPVLSEAVVADSEVPAMNEAVVTDSEVPVLSEDVVTDTEVPVLSEAVVTDIEVPAINEAVVVATEEPVISEAVLTDSEVPVLSEAVVVDPEVKVPVVSVGAVVDSEVVITSAAAFQSEQDLVQQIAHPQHDAVETVISGDAIDLDQLNSKDVASHDEYQYRQLDHQNQLNHQKIIDTYRQIIEMYK